MQNCKFWRKNGANYLQLTSCEVFIHVLVIITHDTALCMYTTLMTLCIKCNHSKCNIEPYHGRCFLGSFCKVFNKNLPHNLSCLYSIAGYCFEHSIKNMFCVSDRFIICKLLLFTAVITLHENSFPFFTTKRTLLFTAIARISLLPRFTHFIWDYNRSIRESTCLVPLPGFRELPGAV
jgi:hypothetical protein